MAIKDEGTASYDLNCVLGSDQRDFLVRNNNDQVKISSLIGKTVGLYFSGSWSGRCLYFTPKLVRAYEQLSEKSDFEVVFVSSDRDEESFSGYFGKMSWLAVPFSDSGSRKKLQELFDVKGVLHLVILDKNGGVLTREGDDVISEFGADGYPFTPERINQLREEEELARRDQSLRSLLVNSSRDYLVSNDGSKVSVSELEGKTVALHFALSTSSSFSVSTPKLISLYENLKEKGENFEIVTIPFDRDEEAFEAASKNIPGFSLPVGDKNIEKLMRYFELSGLPTVVILGTDGKTIHPNAADAIVDHGSLAYPFTPEKLAEFKEIEKAWEEAQTLESVLVSGDLNFLVGKEGQKVLVSDLVGKHVLLYFSAHWCFPCRAFTPKLMEVYHEIKAKVEDFEIILISSDRDQSAFDEYYATMPWLALPFGDERKLSLSLKFKVKGIPALVALGPTGKTMTTNARNLIMEYGAKAFPFTKEVLEKLEAESAEVAKGWPEKVTHELHEARELVLSKLMSYVCDGCNESGAGWSYLCRKCDFVVHPKCVLEEKKDEVDHDDVGVKCDGDVCYRT